MSEETGIKRPEDSSKGASRDRHSLGGGGRAKRAFLAWGWGRGVLGLLL